MSPAGPVVVTGAGGFAGTWLCRHLRAQGRDVVGWVRRPPPQPVPGVQYATVDITDAAACARALSHFCPAQVMHLAAVTHLGDAERDPALAWATNVEGTRQVLGPLPPEVPAVLVSTCHVYGPPLRLPVGEDHPTAPEGVYARSKHAAEEAARQAHPRVVIARPFHHTGPGQSRRFALADWAAQLADRRVRGSLEPLRVGALDRVLDYSDVRDIVAGLALLADAPPGLYNLCSGQGRSLRSLLEAMMADAPVQVEVEVGRLRSRPEPPLVGDAHRARALGWAPSRDLDATLREMVSQNQEDFLRQDPG